MAFQEFDQISARVELERKQKAKKRITIAIVSSVAVLLIVGAAVGTVVITNNNRSSKSSNNNNNKNNNNNNNNAARSTAAPTINTASRAVKSVCDGTDFKQTCEDSLLKAVQKNNQSNAQPKDLLRASFAVAAEEIEKVLKDVTGLKLDTPQKKAAFDDCMVLLNDAKEELNSSISNVEGKDWSTFSTRTPDLNNWLSAVLSYQQTCIDGFPDGEEKASLEKFFKNAKELGSNALAIVSHISSIITQFQGPDPKRRLLELNDGGEPGWIDEEYHRILKADASNLVPNVTVAKDGSGQFPTINEALNAMPKEYKDRYVIYVKEGVYVENVVITKTMVNVTIFGDGSQKSVIAGSKNFVDGIPVYQTATFVALGEGFIAQSIGFKNTAGPEKHQAVALRVQADRSAFVNCRMEGYENALYAQTHRQFYRSCYITGTVDFIFGDAAAVFQNCMIYIRKPMENQQNIVTAQGRFDKRQTSGFVLHNSRILADETLEPEKAKVKSYLGRPPKEYSRTVVMESEIGDLIQPEGWLEFRGDFAFQTLYFAEFNNKGPGSSTAARVKWPGYKVLSKEEALNYTIGPFLQGESWLKNPDIPVRFGMYS